MHEIRVSGHEGDPRGEATQHHAASMLGEEGLSVTTNRVYRLEGVGDDQAMQIAERLLTDPVTESFIVAPRDDWDDPHRVEVAYKPGVTDPVTDSFLYAAGLLGVRPVAVDSSVEYDFGPTVDPEVVSRVTRGLLVNKTVQEVRLSEPETLRLGGEVGRTTRLPIREASTTDLMDLSKKYKFHLDQTEMTTIQRHFRALDREPTDCELQIIAARWSEHCGHKTFNARLIVDGQEKAPLFTRIKAAAKRHFGERVVSAFDDNSGVMRFYEGFCINGKVETHNSPSALEPYGGAMTGSGGVFRDIMGTGLGARVILSTDMFCFARPDFDKAALPVGVLPPDYLMRRVIDGVRDYGNPSGIPTGNGSLHFHPDFRAKPSVIVGAYGIMPEEYVEKGHPQLGDLVVTIGGRTGRDGINGATFSSGSMTGETVTLNSSSVQIGNPIEEKRVMDALLEARDAGCIRALTDCGAAGFSSAVGEIGEDIGVDIDVSRAPLKYEGLAPWEIWLSESQERMVAAISPDSLERFQAICDKHGVEIAVLGLFDGSQHMKVRYGDEVVADLDYEFLKHGLEQREMLANWTAPAIVERQPIVTDLLQTIEQVLAHGNVCSKEPIVRQYDHGVQGTSALPPFTGVNHDGPNDAVVLTPLLGKPYGFVQSHGMNPVLNNIDPYHGSVWAFAEAVSNYVAVGGDPRNASAINNYIWPSPTERTMGSLDMSVDAVVDCMDILKIPVISGKDSLSSTYDGSEFIEIPPVLTISIFGGIEDVRNTVTSDLKASGSQLVLVGASDYAGMGGSTFYDVAGGESSQIPQVSLYGLPAVLDGVHGAIMTGQVLACHDVSEGGLIGAVAEMSFGGDLGCELDLESDIALTTKLFNETAGCFVVELAPSVDPDVLFGNLPYQVIGKTLADTSIVIKQAGEEQLTTSVQQLKAAWQRPMQEFYA